MTQTHPQPDLQSLDDLSVERARRRIEALQQARARLDRDYDEATRWLRACLNAKAEQSQNRRTR